MEIPECGYDCKGKQYQKKEIGKIKDLTGQVFTYLTPLFRVEGQRTSWLCKCKCGNLIIEQANHLVENTVKSCGCYNKEQSKQRRTLDYQGQQFGELTVLERVERETPRSHSALLKCRCSCGKITLVSDVNLISGNTKSCGHLKTDIEDLTGQQFGYWQVLKMAPHDKHHIQWICRCRCGTIKTVRGDSLKAGISQSCGCKNTSVGAEAIENILNENHINYKKEYCFSDLKSPKQAFLRFDFAIINDNNTINSLIEYDGELHYQARDDFGGEEGLAYRKQCDAIKNNYCLNHNIPLYRIPYFIKNFNKIEDIINPQFLL